MHSVKWSQIFSMLILKKQVSRMSYWISSREKQKMANIGDDFRSWYKFLKMFYTIEMTPNEAYDSVIIVKEATPTNVME